MILTVLAALSLPLPDVGQPTPAADTRAANADFVIDGFRFTGDQPVSDALRRSLAAQVRIVTEARLKPDIMALFRAQPIRLVPVLGQPGRAGQSGVTLEMSVQPEDNPVLLHELVHVYHATRRQRDPTILAAFAAARTSGRWPAGSYMLSNPREFFAMTASVVLHGRAARPPFTAEAVREAMPDFARWIEREFRGD